MAPKSTTFHDAMRTPLNDWLVAFSASCAMTNQIPDKQHYIQSGVILKRAPYKEDP